MSSITSGISARNLRIMSTTSGVMSHMTPPTRV